MISGSSFGAIAGAFYSAGFSTKEMRSIIDEVIYSKSNKFWEIYKKSDFIKYFDLLDPSIRTGGLIKGEKLIKFMGRKIKVKQFNDLGIPLKVIATDYYKKSQVIIDDGELLPAVRASYSLPALFSPVKLKGSLLIDGGMVNPLPYDVLKNECDITVAIDAAVTNSSKENGSMPPSYEILFSAFQIMQNSIVNEKLKQSKPDIHIKTNIEGVRVHEFMKAESIYEQALPSKEELKSKLKKLLSI